MHNFTIKCVVYGALAARFAGKIPTVSAVTGLGQVFTTNSLRNRLLRPFVAAMYRVALKTSQVIFQNPDDLAAFTERGLVASSKCHVIRGSGVNTKKFFGSQVEKPRNELTIIMVARLLREKGVREYLEAAALVRAHMPHARICLAGDADVGNPSSISMDEIRKWDPTGNVQLLGHVADVANLLRSANIAVLPSYREGTPRSMIEAAACELPLVATDVPGCREIVRHGENGLLVAPFDSVALAGAILQLCSDPSMRRRMGLRSREIVETEFAEERVIASTVAVYENTSTIRR